MVLAGKVDQDQSDHHGQHTLSRNHQQEETRGKRLQKIIPMIKSEVGLNDKYRKV